MLAYQTSAHSRDKALIPVQVFYVNTLDDISTITDNHLRFDSHHLFGIHKHRHKDVEQPYSLLGREL